MNAIDAVPPGEYVPSADERVLMYGVPWEHYEVFLALRGEKAVPRISYLDGVMEIMSPSHTHERITSYIGRLIEAYADEVDLEFTPVGSWTLKEAPKQAGVEPDECYIFGSDQKKEVPDLVIEVIWTSGGLDKLDAYRRLGIREVWFWKDNEISIFVREGSSFESRTRSHFLPDLDPALLCSLIDEPSASQARKALRAALAAKR